MTSNTGHGHVRPRPDGVKARCGGAGTVRGVQSRGGRHDRSRRASVEHKSTGDIHSPHVAG